MNTLSFHMPFNLSTYRVEKPTKAFLFLMQEFGMTQRDAQRLISKGRIFVDSTPVTDAKLVLEGEFEVVRFVPKSRNLAPIFTHKHFALFDKPSGLLVHPSSMKTPYCLLDEAKYHFGDVANITHRIDQETSGLVLISRDKETEIALKTAFEDRKIAKSYLALVKGKVEKALDIDAPISRHNDQEAIIRIMMKISPEGKPSQTHIEPKKYFEDLDMTLVVARPQTGRQHQIRVHLFHMGHPIIGDPIYNVPINIASDFLERKLTVEDRITYSGASRLLLHAQSLEFDFRDENFLLESEVDFEDECIKILFSSSQQKS